MRLPLEPCGLGERGGGSRCGKNLRGKKGEGCWQGRGLKEGKVGAAGIFCKDEHKKTSRKKHTFLSGKRRTLKVHRYLPPAPPRNALQRASKKNLKAEEEHTSASLLKAGERNQKEVNKGFAGETKPRNATRTKRSTSLSSADATERGIIADQPREGS